MHTKYTGPILWCSWYSPRLNDIIANVTVEQLMHAPLPGSRFCVGCPFPLFPFQLLFFPFIFKRVDRYEPFETWKVALPGGFALQAPSACGISACLCMKRGLAKLNAYVTGLWETSWHDSNPLCVQPRKRVVCVPWQESCHEVSHNPVT
jgi:hypothetical protein